jgi:hypothetical protein
MKRPRTRLLATLGACLLFAGTIVLVSGPVSNSTPATTGAGGPIRQVGTAASTKVGEVDISKLPSAPEAATASALDRGPLRMDGSSGPKPRVEVAKPAATNLVGPLVVTPNVVQVNFNGTTAAQSSCGCQPPDSNGAVNGTYIVEANNLSLATWNKTPNPPALVNRVALNTFLGTADSLSDPRVFYDNVWNRWVLTVIVVPATSTSIPAFWIAVSKTTSPTGAWWLVRATFNGFGTVTLLDYPMVGMDSDAVAIATNNFSPGACTGGFCYTNSSVITVAKARLYNGVGWGVPIFSGVSFSSHPAFVEGSPQAQDGALYVVASRIPYGQSGLDVYQMTNTAKSNTSLVFLGTVADPLNLATAPNCATQPGGGTCLDALDGRLQTAPKQYAGRVWWTRAAGFPVVEYGAITISGLTTTSAVAYLRATSNDWNPSIGVGIDPGGRQRVFLNWSVDDPSAGTPLQVSQRISGLGPVDPVQNLIGIGTTLFTGGHGNDFRFGDYSSVAIDRSTGGCTTTGKGALVVNEVFAGGTWVNHLARVCFP